MSQKSFTVSTLIRYIKSKLDNDLLIQNIDVEGEISNFNAHYSGHWYFSIKDSNSVIPCIMYAGNTKTAPFFPKDGDKIIAHGSVTIYQAQGKLQLVVSSIKKDSIGDLYLQFELLKKKLSEEGLFDEKWKKEIPLYPMHIGLVTGKSTAARADVLTTLNRRWPVAKIHEYPVLVQGADSAKEIVEALQYIDTLQYDVVLLVRGGGSIEDLMSFNDETVARTIFQMNTPIIVGVGHEVDFTIADFVADVRAATPTAAAELCSPDLTSVQNEVQDYKERLLQAMTEYKERMAQELTALKNSRVFLEPARLTLEKNLRLQTATASFQHQITSNLYTTKQHLNTLHLSMQHQRKAFLQENQNHLSNLQTRLTQAMNQSLQQAQRQLKERKTMLQVLSPDNILKRGYAIVQKGDEIIKRIDTIQEDDAIQIQLYDGIIHSTVTGKESK